MNKPTRVALAGFALAVTVGLAACGGDKTSAGEAETATGELSVTRLNELLPLEEDGTTCLPHCRDAHR